MGWKKINDEHLTSYADSIRYTKDGTVMPEIERYTPSQMETELQNIAEGYVSAVDELAQDNTYFSEISTAIVDKDGGSPPEKADMAERIEALEIAEAPPIVLELIDWEGTVLKGYSAQSVQNLTELPAPNSFPAYNLVDHEFMVFQEWNWLLENIKTWITNHPNRLLKVGATYTTTDGQDHDYFLNPRLEETPNLVRVKKVANTSSNIGFFKCTTLKNISLPKNVKIGYYAAFCSCDSIETVVIPRGITNIGDNMFDSSHSLKTICLPDTIETIRVSFRNCYTLEYLEIPDSVITMNGGFGACYALKYINIPKNASVATGYAFSNCSSLLEIELPDTTTAIGENAFYGCVSLQKVNIPDSVTSLLAQCFLGCYSLPKLVIPENVTYIRYYAFRNNYSLADIVLKGKPSLENVNAFDGTYANYRIYVPSENLSWFENETNWSTIYTANHFVTIEDNIEHLESIGIDVDEYKGGIT